MPVSGLSKEEIPSRNLRGEEQRLSDRSLLFVQPDGQVAQVAEIVHPEGSSVQRTRTRPDPYILRFRESERLLHWAIAIPFMICWITALILMLVYNPDPARPYRIVFATLHRISGVCLVFLPVIAMLIRRGDFGFHLYNVKHAWRWTLDDVKWLSLMGIAAINKKISLPQQGKFNAAEKVNFIVGMVTWPVFAATGVLMWIHDASWFPWLVHVTAAFLVTPAMLGHIYMAVINPDTRKGLSGMISGYVGRQWAKHHYARWYEEVSFRSATRDSAHADGKRKSAG